MPDKKPEWSDYSYDNDSISERLDISKEEVKKLKAEAAKKAKEDSPLPGSTNEVLAGIAGLKNQAYISGGTDLAFGSFDPGISLGIPGVIEVDWSEGGNGNIDILKLIKVVTIRIKCYYVQRFYFAGQFLYSDIIKVDSEECNESEPEPEPEPPDPSLDDIDETPKPPKPPKVPNYQKPFVGLYSQKLVIYKKELEYSSGYLSVYKGLARSWMTRLNLDSDPYSDIWIINYSISTSWNVLNPKPLSPPSGSSKAKQKWFLCLSPYKLMSKGIIILYDFRFYYLEIKSENIVYGSTANDFAGSDGEGTPYGHVQYLYGHSGKPNNSEIFAPNGTWAGGFIQSGNTQSVPYLLRGGIIESYNINDIEYQSKYYFTAETNQILNFEDLVPPQLTKNPPIRINIGDDDMDQDCCKLLRRLAKYQGLGSKTPPLNVAENKIEEKGGDNIFPVKIPTRWIDRDAKPKDDYEIKNMRHLILSIGIMLDRFEELFNPAGKDKGFPLKKPEQGLWKWLPGDGGDYEAPDPDYDPKKSKNDGKIKNKKLKINTYLDLFRYFLESQIRMEMLFPIAQIRDSEISKRLIYPKAPGKIKINDMIQLQELLLLYLNKTLGDPSASVIIKDADPTKAGDQPITVENFDISDMMRKLIRFSYDINADVDLSNNFNKRTLYQLLSAMQVLVKNHEMTEAIFEDLGMKEEQVFVPVKFFADPYAGAWKAGEGFDPNKIKIENTEKGIEENLEAFLTEKEVDVKVSRRAKDETTDLRDLLSQIGRYAAELAAQGKIPNTPEAIQQAIDKARFEIQTESALRRTDVRQASTAGRVRTKRNKTKGKKP